jgi:hypothetical protein
VLKRNEGNNLSSDFDFYWFGFEDFVVFGSELEGFVVGGHTGGDEELGAEFGDAGVEFRVAGGFEGWEGSWRFRVVIVSQLFWCIAQLKVKLEASSRRGKMLESGEGGGGIPGDAAENEP